MIPLKGASTFLQLLGRFIFRTFLVVRVRINAFVNTYLGYLLAICGLKELFLSLAEGTQHALWKTLPVGNGLLEVDIEILIMIQAETIIALISFLKLQKQVTLLPLVLSLLEDFIVVLIVALVLAGGAGATHHLKLTPSSTFLFLLFVHPIIILDLGRCSGRGI